MKDLNAQSAHIADKSVALVICAMMNGLSYEEASIAFLVCAKLMKLQDENPHIPASEMGVLADKWTKEELLRAQSKGTVQ